MEDGIPKQKNSHRHFLSGDHLFEDCEMMFPDETDFSDPTRRTFFCMYEHKTSASFGLNICEII